MEEKKTSSPKKLPPLYLSLIPVAFLLGGLALTVVHYKMQPHIILIFTVAVTSILASLIGISWSTVLKSMSNAVASTLPAVFLLLIVGMLIASWIQSGIVPALIYYGFKLVSPKLFLMTSAVISGIISLATGSSWSTAGTVGVALMGIGSGLGIPPEMTAGSIISGAYFGDKMSPLSDTTNLAPAVAGTDLFTHIRHMMWTTVPGLTLALIGYLILGFVTGGGSSSADSSNFILPLQKQFNISPWLLIPPTLVIILVATKKPALPSLMAGVVLGMIFAAIFQGTNLRDMLKVAKSGYVSHTGSASLDKLLTRGGLDNMLDTVALILSAISFGGAMEGAGFLQSITSFVLKTVKSTGSLILATVLTAIGLNVIAGDQYISIVIPGRMYKSAYKNMNLAPQNLSRALEDSGTLTSSLVPWNTGGAFMWSTLGVFPLYYLPFAFLNLLNPVISVFYGFTGITITKLNDYSETKNNSKPKTNNSNNTVNESDSKNIGSE